MTTKVIVAVVLVAIVAVSDQLVVAVKQKG